MTRSVIEHVDDTECGCAGCVRLAQLHDDDRGWREPDRNWFAEITDERADDSDEED